MILLTGMAWNELYNMAISDRLFMMRRLSNRDGTAAGGMRTFKTAAEFEKWRSNGKK